MLMTFLEPEVVDVEQDRFALTEFIFIGSLIFLLLA